MSDDAPTPSRPFYRDPFVIAFALGAMVLTALPFFQRRFLTAPPPIATLAPWRGELLPDGAPFEGRALAGHVWLATFVAPGCDAGCVAEQEAFGRSLAHVDDLDGGVLLVTFVMPGGEGAVQGWADHGTQWRLVGGAGVPSVLEQLRGAWGTWAGTDAGSTPEEFSTLPAVVLVDQAQAVRGFWQGDTAGRGNAINAARLLASHGVHP